MNTQTIEISQILKHLKTLAQTHPNKSQLAESTGVRYHRVQLYCSREDGMLWPDELQQLADYFGLKIYADIVPTALSWLPHPANPTIWEYEVDSSRRPTGNVRAIEVPSPKLAVVETAQPATE